MEKPSQSSDGSNISPALTTDNRKRKAPDTDNPVPSNDSEEKVGSDKIWFGAEAFVWCPQFFEAPVKKSLNRN